ncbi:MurR/RpiR family transcriptional regulator [Planococcus sp. S3-L1]|uniref:MurR/RpiR family transcriptional regulator n=1 Tax=Planococcus sp. S3-L1 TaxID=3046200 RepID=UPI0024B87B12|nr:MurR/RpiR family transcriptional regulator [Planococcus sp. S3-L1]MDJ0332986.1 MurR/RpiR family transcriptional regulator [Planococcus sp. S3-L1]
MKNFEELLKSKYLTLSKGQKKVADSMLENPMSFGMSTANQIARKIDVSETTVIRLSYALGFDTFTQMQKRIQQEYVLKNKVQQKENDQTEEIVEDDFISRLIKRDIEILQNLQKSFNSNEYWSVVDEIMAADEVKIVGYRASYAPAHWLYLKLGMLRKEVKLFSQNMMRNPDELLLNPQKKVVFIVISFPSYAAETLEIAESASKRGATIIAISDRLLSPVSRMADISLITEINVESENLISVSSIMSLLNIIATGIEKKYETEILERVNNLKILYKERGYFLE